MSSSLSNNGTLAERDEIRLRVVIYRALVEGQIHVKAEGLEGQAVLSKLSRLP